MLANIVIVLLIVGYCAYIIYTRLIKKKGGCGGDCAGCSGCSSHTDFNKHSHKKGKQLMGNSTGSMFYAFAIFIILYIVGVSAYQIYKFIQKKLKNRGDSSKQRKEK